MRHHKTINQGFSLVELMIAMVLGLAVVGAVALLSVNATRSYRAINQANQQLENGRYALSILKDDLEHAGFYGAIAPVKLTLPESDPNDPCDLLPQTHTESMIIPVRGYTASPGSCNLTSLQPHTNILVTRRADTTTTPPNSPTAGNTYIQSTPDKSMIGWCRKNGNNQNDSDHDSDDDSNSCTTYPDTPEKKFVLRRPHNENTLADIRRYHVHIYYIRSWATTSGDGIPTLVRVSLTRNDSAPAMTSEPMIEGIENLQFQWGLDAAVGTVCPYTELPADCDGAPGFYVASISSSENGWKDWANVVTVRINLLARSLDPDRNYTDNKTYDLGETDDVGNRTLFSPPSNALNYPRHVFSQVVRIHHPGGWRDREK